MLSDNTDNTIGVMQPPISSVKGMSPKSWRDQAQENLKRSLKMLLETKHLYQSTVVNLDIQVHPGFAPLGWEVTVLTEKWGVRDNATSRSFEGPGGANYDLTLEVPDVKLFCRKCERAEAYNSLSSQEFTGRSTQEPDTRSANGAIQVFILSFLCQACKEIPEVFLVRRQGLRLTLCGRAPMEVAEVPASIPKPIREYYSGALVAYQSGQTLAGLFLLRTLIEQWARSQVKKPSPSRADQLMDKYMAMLPEDFNRNFPSMRKLYDQISADLHIAAGSGDLFDTALVEIAEHFDARKVFKL